MNGFETKLRTAATKNTSLVCIGLDPSPTSMPIKNIASFNKAIIEATSDLVCAYKPNYGFYEAEGLGGLRALEQTIKAIPPEIPVILDAKRGDIGNTATAYAKAAFEFWGADAVTVNPYMGMETIEPFLAYEERGTFILIRTSNDGASDFQELQVAHTDSSATGNETAWITLYESVAQRAVRANVRGNVGLVAGATAAKELAKIRSLAGDIPILIPGIGTQGGDLASTVQSGVDSTGQGAIINSSRGIIFASKGSDFASAARTATDHLRVLINQERERLGFGWK